MTETEQLPPAKPCKDIPEFIRNSELARKVIASMVPVGHKVKIELYRPVEGDFKGKMEVLDKRTKKQIELAKET